MSTFPLRLDAVWRAPLLIISATPKRARLEIDEESLDCRFGWWQDRIDIADIVSVEPMTWRWYWGIGMRIGSGKTLGLIGSTKGVVVMTLRRERLFKLPFKMKFRRLAVSLERPDEFVAALQKRLDAPS